MKILFFYRGSESLGVGYLMSVLREAGHEVELVFDPGIDDTLFVRARMLSWFNRYDRLIEKARQFDPDLIALSVLTNLYPFVKRAARIFKEILPRVPIIAGGHHVTGVPEYVLQNPNIDMICMGEGEETIVELADLMNRGRDYSHVQNIWLKQKNEIIRNDLRPLISNLDSIPFPSKEEFFRYGCFSETLEIVTSRGCPFKCTFCNSSYLHRLYKGKGKYLRRRSTENVLAELEEYLDRYHYKYVAFHDDTFTFDTQWIKEFAPKYRKRIGLPFFCLTNPLTTTEKTVQLLKEAGCIQVFLGIEAGDAQVRSSILGRPMSEEKIINAARLIKEAGIKLQVSGIFASPGETADQMWRTVEMTESVQPDASAGFLCYPFPGTEMQRRGLDSGLISAADWKAIQEGQGSYKHGSVFHHPEADLAYCITKLLAIHNKGPRFLRRLCRIIARRRWKRLSQLMFILSIPFAFLVFSRDRMKRTLRTLWRAQIAK